MRISETGGSAEDKEHRKVIDQGTHFEKAIASEEKLQDYAIMKRKEDSDFHLGSVLVPWWGHQS
jgi:hypothetical protein